MTAARTINCKCSACGRRISVHLLAARRGRSATIRFLTREAPQRRITACPHCGRDFSFVTAEQFLEQIADWS
jgi:hypothetical protein